MIPYSRQDIDDIDIQAVVDVLKSDYLTTGPKIKEFEDAIASYIGVKYAVAVINGTAALHLACLAAQLESNAELITSAMTFAASANCALYCGAKPVFCDINAFGLLDPDQLEPLISQKSKILIPVHYSGRPCDMKRIHTIAQKHKMVIIEDACHALGATYAGENIGNCRYSDMAVFSFHPVKHITTGEGGLITTNSKDFYKRLIVLRTHGITKEDSDLLCHEGSWYHEMQMLGYNYRITDIQCALGLSQMRRLDTFVKRRKEIAQYYYDAFENYPHFSMIHDSPDAQSSFHLFPILLSDHHKVHRRLIFDQMRKNKLGIQVHYIPVYWHPYYQNLGYTKGMCPKAEDFYQREISIPMYPAMSNDDVEYVIITIKKIFQEL